MGVRDCVEPNLVSQQQKYGIAIQKKIHTRTTLVFAAIDFSGSVGKARATVTLEDEPAAVATVENFSESKDICAQSAAPNTRYPLASRRLDNRSKRFLSEPSAETDCPDISKLLRIIYYHEAS